MASNNEVEDGIKVKAILIGNMFVGKTSLINASIGMKFNPLERTTISANYVKKEMKIDKTKYIINLWDTAGQEKLKSMTKLFFKGANIVIFVYDITDEKSFQDLEKWIKDVKDILENNYICGIVGNKKDLYLKEVVKEEEAKQLANLNKMNFKLVSAKEDPKGFVDFLEVLIRDASNILLPQKNKTLNGKKGKKENCGC